MCSISFRTPLTMKVKIRAYWLYCIHLEGTRPLQLAEVGKGRKLTGEALSILCRSPQPRLSSIPSGILEGAPYGCLSHSWGCAQRGCIPGECHHLTQAMTKLTQRSLCQLPQAGVSLGFSGDKTPPATSYHWSLLMEYSPLAPAIIHLWVTLTYC